jgi:hypothetical protein
MQRFRIHVYEPLRKFHSRQRINNSWSDHVFRTTTPLIDAPGRLYGMRPGRAALKRSCVARMCHVPSAIASPSANRWFFAKRCSNLASFNMIASAPIRVRTRCTCSRSRRCLNSSSVPGGRPSKSGGSGALNTDFIMAGRQLGTDRKCREPVLWITAALWWSEKVDRDQPHVWSGRGPSTRTVATTAYRRH